MRLDPKFLRPAEVEHLIGDASKARDDARLDAGCRFLTAGDDDGRRGSGAADGGQRDASPGRAPLVLEPAGVQPLQTFEVAE